LQLADLVNKTAPLTHPQKIKEVKEISKIIKVLYISGEETIYQIADRAKRL
jgi:hypothetical protein